VAVVRVSINRNDKIMKRIIAFLVGLLISLSVMARGSNLIGGSVGMVHPYKMAVTISPHVLREFDNRWAVGIGVGFGFVCGGDEEKFAVIEPYGRFDIWNNGFVFFDVKAKACFGFNEKPLVSQIGFCPSLMFCLGNRWEISADVGLLGAASTIRKEWAFKLTGGDLNLLLAYRL